MKKLLIIVVIIVLALLIWWGLSSDTTEAPSPDDGSGDVMEEMEDITDLEGLDDANLEAEFEDIDSDLESL